MSHEGRVTLGLDASAEGMFEVFIEGRLGWGMDDQIKTMLAESAGEAWESQGVVLNMSDVGFLDSAGISSLLSLNRYLAESGGKMVLCNVPPRINQMFNVVGMSRAISVVDDRLQAQKVCEA